MRAYLPEKLAANIKIDQTGVNLCDTVGSRTVYCIHAAREMEHADGKIALHDVSIDLYGKNGDRNNRIYGDDFEYDQKAGVVRAIGLVNLDLQAAQQDAGKAAPGTANGKVLHVTTSNLVYLNKLGVAATNEYIEFQSGAMRGHATGADYSSDSGVLTMRSSVRMSGVAGERPLDVTAATAQADNRNREIFLTGARCVSLGQTVEAQRATLHTRPDGTLARVQAQGNVTSEVKGSKLASQQADVVLNAKSQPQSAVLTGGVQYSSNLPLLQRSAKAEEATIAFDAQGQASNAVFTGAVHMNERTRATEAAREPWSSRDLTAAKVEAALVPVNGTSQVRDVVATGSAHLTSVNNGTLASSKGIGREEMSADVLTAHMVVTGDGKQPPQLDTVAGRGHTLLHQVTANGIDQTSSGDTLDAKFRAQPPTSGVAGRQTSLFPSGGETLMPLSAVQQGHVTMVRRASAKAEARPGANSGNAQEDVQHANAQRAAYDGILDRMTLTGDVELTGTGEMRNGKKYTSELWASQVALDHKTGDAQATGSVKMNYMQDASSSAGGGRTALVQAQEPTHVLAERAELDHANEIATFFGKPVRLWQGGDQVQAPVIEFARAVRRLIARGDTTTGWSTGAQDAQVLTVLSSAGADASGAAKSGAASQMPPCSASAARAGAAKAGAGAEGKSPSVVRIASGGLVYSDLLRQADFTGGFRADTVDGTIRAGAGTVYMQKSGGDAASSGDYGPTLGGDVDHMVATRQVELDKPGIHATGERLVYTTSDRLVVLTGDDKAPPTAVGPQGTTTGAALRFNSCNGSVEALGAEGQRVRTNAQIGKDEKKDKEKQ